MKGRTAGATAAAVLALLVVCADASAQEPADCMRDLRATQTTLDLDARHSRAWRWGWTAIDSALFAGSLALLPLLPDDTKRIEYVVNAGKAAFVVAVLAIHPPRVIADARVLDAHLEATTLDGVVADPCIARARGRELLSGAAGEQAFATGWAAHTFVVTSNVAIGVVEGLLLHDWLGAILQGVGSIVVGEIQIFTQPTGALRARDVGTGF